MIEKEVKQQRRNYLKYQVKIKKKVRRLHSKYARKLERTVRGVKTRTQARKALKNTSKQYKEEFMDILTDTVSEYQEKDIGYDIEMMDKLFNNRPKLKLNKDILKDTYTKMNKENLKELVNRKIGDKTISDRVWQIADKNGDELFKILEDDYASKKSWTQTARDLRKYMRGKKAYWKGERLVRTEMANLNAERVYRKGKGNPAYLGIIWHLSNSHRSNGVSCLCVEYDGRKFKQGNEPVLPHPNCMCWQEQWIMDEKDWNSNLDDWIAGKSVPSDMQTALDSMLEQEFLEIVKGVK